MCVDITLLLVYMLDFQCHRRCFAIDVISIQTTAFRKTYGLMTVIFQDTGKRIALELIKIYDNFNFGGVTLLPHYPRVPLPIYM